MQTVKCNQCDKQFSKPSKKKAESALLMHIGRKHSNTISNTGIIRRRRTKEEMEAARQEANGSVAVLTDTRVARKPGRPANGKLNRRKGGKFGRSIKATAAEQPALPAPTSDKKAMLIEVMDHFNAAVKTIVLAS